MERCPPFPYDLTNCRYMFLNDKVGGLLAYRPSTRLSFVFYIILSSCSFNLLSDGRFALELIIFPSLSINIYLGIPRTE